MNNRSRNGEILRTLIEEDYGVSGNSKWGRSRDHSSLVIDYEKGIFYFNAENIVGDPFVYLTKVRGYSPETAREYLKDFGYSGTHVYIAHASGEDVVVYPDLVPLFHELGRHKRDYWYRRGLTDYTIDRFQLGWYNEFNWIPFFQDGTFRNFQMRRDDPKTIKKYYKGVGPLLFNSDILNLTDEVFFVEGPVDAMILAQHGLPAISTDMAGNVLPQWYVKFVRQKRIYVVTDNDDAGVEEGKRVARMLGITRCPIYTFADYEMKGYDPVDFFRDGGTRDEFVELVRKQSKYIFELPKKGWIKT